MNWKKMRVQRLVFLTTFIFGFVPQLVLADPPVEGFWLPLLLDPLTMQDMQANGLHLSAEDINSANHASLKDAVVLFSNNCTGAVISAEGLLLTNHHCAGGRIRALNDSVHDYVKDGYWAMSRAEELPCRGLTVTFIISMEDITAQVLKGLNSNIGEEERNRKIDSVSAIIANQRIKGTHYGAQVKTFYNGNQYFLFITETFNDIRLVGAPPVTIGDFGGETDNWSWPRQTGDFSVFRIYADRDNLPSAYSPDNVPFKPRHFFPVSLKGVHENDFTMVLGFPGRSNEYATSYAIDFTMNVAYADRIKTSTKTLDTWWQAMQINENNKQNYQNRYNGLTGNNKKWRGEVYGLKKAQVIAQKQHEEQEFQNRIQQNNTWQQAYGTLLHDLENAYDTLKQIQPLIDYGDALMGADILSFAAKFQPLVQAAFSKSSSPSEMQEEISKMKMATQKFFSTYDAATDKKLLAAMLDLYGDATGFPGKLNTLHSLAMKYQHNSAGITDQLFAASFLDEEDRVMQTLDKFTKSNAKKLMEDPFYLLVNENANYEEEVIDPIYDRLRERITILSRQYMAAQMEVMREKKFYPDANLTLRIAYGKVQSYDPRNGVHYNYFTTLDGAMEKAATGVEDYAVPERLRQLFDAGDFGPYADVSGKLNTCFIASNHTSGGNSGSPVLDADGNLTGLNFDRVWEGTMSDYYWNPDQCRNISLDIRYALFIIDKYAGAGYLLKEMKLVR